MNKSDLINSIARSANISKVSAERGLEGMLHNMFAAMEGGERINLAGFGSFSTIERASRLGRNPRTGEEVTIPSRRGVKFRPGKALTEIIR